LILFGLLLLSSHFKSSTAFGNWTKGLLSNSVPRVLESYRDVTLAMKNTIHIDLQNHLTFFSPILMFQESIKSLTRVVQVFGTLHWAHLVDLSIILLILRTYRGVFKKIFSITHRATDDFNSSLLGSMQTPIAYTLYYGPFLYMLDLAALVLHSAGFQFHLKVSTLLYCTRSL
jgi:hypothetical protein